jgi:hypothetical protein
MLGVFTFPPLLRLMVWDLNQDLGSHLSLDTLLSTLPWASVSTSVKWEGCSATMDLNRMVSIP